MAKFFTKTVSIILVIVLCMSNLEVQGAFNWVKWHGTYSGWSVGAGGSVSHDWKVGARWTAGDLTTAGIISGDRITKVKILVLQKSFISSCSIEIYQGGSWPSNEGTLIRQQTVSVGSLIEGDTTVVVLNNPVPINTSQELWVVYRVVATGGMPFAIDDAIAVNQKGNIMYANNAWTTLSTVSPSHTNNWIVEFYAETSPPSITTSTLPKGGIGIAYNQTLTATGTLPITWSVDNGNLPNGLSLSSSGLISGTPTTAGTFNFTAKATNGAGNDTKTLSIAIDSIPNPPTNLSASQSGMDIVVQWQAITNATNYNIYRSSSAVGTYTKIGTSNVANYTDNSPLVGDNYYQVSAVNLSGEGSQSNYVLCNFSTSSFAQVRFQKIQNSSVTQWVITDASTTILATYNIGASSGLSNYNAIPPGQHTPLYYANPNWFYCLPNPYTYNFQAGKKYTVVCDYNIYYVIDDSVSPPVITTANLSDGTVGTVYSQTLTASGDTTITWTIESGNLPNGLSLSSSGVISGTPTTVGTSNFTVKAINNGGRSTKSLSIKINVPVNLAQVRFQKMQNYSNVTQMAVIDTSTTILATYNFGSSSGITSYADILSGEHVPVYYSPTTSYWYPCLPNPPHNTYNFQAGKKYTIVCDDDGTYIVFYVIDESLLPPVITTANLSNGTVGTAYSQTLTASGDAPITWTIESGNLPNGLSISSSGVISGTPTTAGIFNFIVKAINNGGSSTKTLSIKIISVPIITTQNLPNGAVGTAYSQTLTANGDTPITWSKESGNLPNGLTLSPSGVISGTPTTAGTFSFTVKATNSAGNNTKTFSINIGSVGIAGVVQSAGLRVYPNPTTGQLIIDNGELTIENVKIYNMVGQLIQSIIVNTQSEITIDVSPLAAGVYYLKVDGKTVKFVKE